jgi:hypothetical protein
MPANATGWFCHCLARETGKLGHLLSPGQQRGPWPWFPFALDNGCFSLWDPDSNNFDQETWNTLLYPKWRRLIFWSLSQAQKPLWAIVPDRPGDWDATVTKWELYSGEISGVIPLAIAVQDGSEPADVRALRPTPELVCVGGSTDWKWRTAEMWIKEFPRVHVLRCNAPDKLGWLEGLGCESTDGTGWNRGDRKQTKGLEAWARGLTHQHEFPLWPHVCREPKDIKQMTFA